MKNTDKDEDIILKIPNSKKTSDNKEKTDNISLSCKKGTPIVIIGANGSGKTSFSMKIEELNDPYYKRHYEQNDATKKLLVQRISAQKSLVIPETISVQNTEAAFSELYYNGITHNRESKYQYNPHNIIISDYTAVLSLLFAKNNDELQSEHNQIKYNEKTVTPNNVCQTVTDKANEIWKKIFPNRDISFDKNNITMKFSDKKYKGKEMSDGERALLYMICQVLVLKKNSVLIIDEPELHVHKSILNKTWDILENYRRDCVFIYVTHDLDFAISRNTDKVIWMQSYNGNTWEYKILPVHKYSDLPTELLYEILGTREKVLFVEGNKNSYDYRVYKAVFENKGFHIIPSGSCENVIKYVKAQKGYNEIKKIKAYGIIDRDYKLEKELNGYEKYNIYCLKVAEIENLFVVPELLKLMNDQWGCSGAAEEAKEFIYDLFKKNKNNQISAASILELNHQLTIENFDAKNKQPIDELAGCIQDKFSKCNIEKIVCEKKEIFNKAKTLEDILKVFNLKDLSKKIGKIFGLCDGDEYVERILRFLVGENTTIRDNIIQIMSKYIPVDKIINNKS